MVMPSLFSFQWLKAPFSVGAMEDFGLIDDFDATFEPGPEEVDEDEMWRTILPAEDDAVGFAHHFLEPDPEEEMGPPMEEPKEDAVESGVGNDQSDGSTGVRDDVEDEGTTWDPYTVEEYVFESPLVTTPMPKPKRNLDSDDMMETPGSSSSSAPAFKRRRLSAKQPPPNRQRLLPLREEIMHDKSFAELSSLARQTTGVDKVRDLYMRDRRPTLRAQQNVMTNLELNSTIRKEWAEMTKENKTRWLVNTLCQKHGMRNRVISKVEYYKKEHEAALKEEDELMQQPSAQKQLRGVGAMGTWNGTWLDDEVEFQEFIQQVETHEVAEGILELQCFKVFVARLEAFIVQRCEKLGFKFWSYAVEVSTKSDDKGRIHVHAYWHTDETQEERRPHLGTINAWRFEGSRPKIRPNTASGRHAQRLIDRGHYYCQCKKVGHVLSKTNYPKYEAYVVEQKWVIGLWQRRKLTHPNAKEEIINARGHTATYLREIETIETLEEDAAIELEKKCIDAELSGAFKPFRFVPEVCLWRLQYGRDTIYGLWGKESRFKFLVLTGPSCMGKTQYAKTLFGVSNTLVVPCQGVKNPCLKEYRRQRHKAILFDEISSECIHDNKAIFQANNDKVLLGQSPTMRDCYSVFLYGVACIVCCNDWLENIKRSSLEEEWLLANSIVYDCTEKMWVS